jgi:hypothetical protein
MRFGPHTEAVNEVIEFARSGRLLKRAPDDPIPAGIEVTHRADNMIRLMYDPPENMEVPDDYFNWFAIRQKEEAEFSCNSSTFDLRLSISRVFDELLSTVNECLPVDFVRDRDVVSGWIAEDLGNIARRRAVFGIKDGFFERMFRCYQCGGYPCGWRGNYPEGHMIVYFSRHQMGEHGQYEAG